MVLTLCREPVVRVEIVATTEPGDEVVFDWLRLDFFDSLSTFCSCRASGAFVWGGVSPLSRAAASADDAQFMADS